MFAPITKEFRFLSTTRNQAAVACLRGLLDSPCREVRWQAGLALSARSDDVSTETFLEAFDCSANLCRREWKTLGYRLVPTILRVLEDSNHRLYRAALKAIADCELPEGLSKLVRASEQPSSLHGAYAAKQLIRMSMHLGAEVRNGGVESAIRISLLKLLAESLKQFSYHRSSSIAEALLVCIAVDDAEFASILNQEDAPILRVLIRQWRSTQRIEVLELLVSLLGKQFLPKSVCDILFIDRKDLKMSIALARGARSGLSPLALQRFHQNGVPECCQNLQPQDSSIDEQSQWTLWMLIAAGKASLPRLFEGLRWFVGNPSIESQLAIANILRHYPATTCSKFLEAMAPEAMLPLESSNANPENESLNDGSEFRRDIRKLLAVLPTCDANLKGAIEVLFSEFNLEILMQHMDYLMDDAISCFSEIMRAIHPRWPEALIPEMESSVAEKRLKAAVAASYLGPHPDLKLYLNKLQNDEFAMVREEAIFALRDYPSANIPTSVTSSLAASSIAGVLNE